MSVCLRVYMCVLAVGELGVETFVQPDDSSSTRLAGGAFDLIQVCCSVLQCVAVLAVLSTSFRCVAVCCSVLQCVAVLAVLSTSFRFLCL